MLRAGGGLWPVGGEEHEMKEKVLFICVHNSARSQMAEAFLNETCGDEFEASSAGLEPGTLNPVVAEAMTEVGIDISGHGTQAVFDVWQSGQIFASVITVCIEAYAAVCPVFPGPEKRLPSLILLLASMSWSISVPRMLNWMACWRNPPPLIALI